MKSALGTAPTLLRLRHFALSLADLSLELRVAVGLFAFFFHLLMRHLHLILVQEKLQRHVDHGGQKNDQQHQPETADHPLFMS